MALFLLVLRRVVRNKSSNEPSEIMILANSMKYNATLCPLLVTAELGVDGIAR